MKKIFILLAALGLVLSSGTAEARHKRHHHRAVVTHAVHPDCNILWPCAGVEPSARGLRVQKAMGGFGSPKMVYVPKRVSKRAVIAPVREVSNYGAPSPSIVAHPSGCPSRAFCGCGAAVRVFGSPVRSLWLAANWYKFPRAQLAAGMVAVRRHHVFVIEQVLGNGTVMAYDANSGGRQTRIHVRSVAGYTIVNPHGRGYASL